MFGSRSPQFQHLLPHLRDQIQPRTKTCFLKTCKSFNIQCSTALLILSDGEGGKRFQWFLPSLEGAGAGARERVCA